MRLRNFFCLTPFALAIALAGCSGGDAVDPNDRDGDGLTNAQETEGWDVVVDELGYGLAADASFLTRRRVTSDPDIADTDGDGLDDGVELAERSDPRRPDTDNDGLDDAAERNVYKSNLLTADSDGDAIDPDGNTVPLAAMFDGAELAAGTSPTLADTDGDGQDDRAERDVTNRDPRVAEIPQVDMQPAGEIDIRLFVEYADSMGTEETYGSERIQTESQSTSRSDTESTAVTHAASSGGEGFFDDLEFSKAGALKFFGGKALELGRSAACGSAAEGGEVKFDKDNPNAFKETLGVVSDAAGAVLNATGLADTELCAEATPETTNTTSMTLTQESSSSLTQSSSEYRTTRNERTETAARGVVNLGFTFANAGISTVELVAPTVTMMQWVPSPNPEAALGAGTFRTLATLKPAENEESVAVLSPSGPGSTVTIQMTADELNPALIKDFLARPEALFFSPGQFELNDRDGVAFDFLVEETYNRTANLVIDNGREDIRRFQVATNVERNDSGDFAGVSMKTLLNDVLEIPYETREVERRNAAGEMVMVEELHSIEGFANERTPNIGRPAQGIPGDAQGFWIVYTKRESEARADLPFDDVRMYAGDEIRLVYVRDADGDGLLEREERLYNTRDDSVDLDGDGLTDFQEVKNGWIVTIAYDDAGQRAEVAYRVSSNPQLFDADGDGLNDLEEMGFGTDPNNADTDDDGLFDSCEISPLDAEDTQENGVCGASMNNVPVALYLSNGNGMRFVSIGEDGLEQVRVSLPEGAGAPQEMAMTPDKKHLMVSTGHVSARYVQVWDIDETTNALTPSPYAHPERGDRGQYDDRSVIVDPMGQYAWSVDRNGDNEWVDTYSFVINRDQVPGRLEMPRVASNVIEIHSLWAHPSGRFVYATDDQDDRRLVPMFIDRDNGLLGASTDASLPTDIIDVVFDDERDLLYALADNGHLYGFWVDRDNGSLTRIDRVVDTGSNPKKLAYTSGTLLVIDDRPAFPSGTTQSVLSVYRTDAMDAVPVAVDQNAMNAAINGFGGGYSTVAFDESGTFVYAASQTETVELVVDENWQVRETGRSVDAGGDHIMVLNRTR